MHVTVHMVSYLRLQCSCKNIEYTVIRAVTMIPKLGNNQSSGVKLISSHPYRQHQIKFYHITLKTLEK